MSTKYRKNINNKFTVKLETIQSSSWYRNCDLLSRFSTRVLSMRSAIHSQIGRRRGGGKGELSWASLRMLLVCWQLYRLNINREPLGHRSLADKSQFRVAAGLSQVETEIFLRAAGQKPPGQNCNVGSITWLVVVRLVWIWLLQPITLNVLHCKQVEKSN